MSYCNTGFSILGRVIEVVTGKVWDAVMRERLFDPLGLAHTGTLPEEALLHRAAVGPRRAVAWRAAGGRPGVDAAPRLWPDGADQLDRRRRPHVRPAPPRRRQGARRHQLVSAESIGAMREPQVESPDRHTLGTHWGLGVILFEWDGRRVYGHDGGTIGQSSRLRIVPDADLAISLVANGGAGTQQVYEELFGELVAELAGVAMPGPLQAPAQPPDVDLERTPGRTNGCPCATTWRPRTVASSEPSRSAGRSPRSRPDPVTKVTLTPVDGETFLVQDEESETPTPAVFYEFHDGIPQYLHPAPGPTPASPTDSSVRRVARRVALAFGSAHDSVAA